MKDAQNVFYSSISKYYSEIFPFSPAQLGYVKRNSGELTGKKILDIGCATGELSYELALSGARVTGIDLNEDLLDRARTEKVHPDLSFRKVDMLDLAAAFDAGTFDVVLCFGNTLVHLLSVDLVNKVLNSIRYVLKDGGLFLLQILNYDYILSEQVTKLPVIESENIKFIRNYIFRENTPLIGFNTELHLKNEGTVVTNETPLLALSGDYLDRLLKQAGFENVVLFANFQEEPYGGKHLPLVMKAFSGK